MSIGLDDARRLELTELSQVGDQIQGRFGGFQVALLEAGEERALTMVLDRPAQWSLVRAGVQDGAGISTGDLAFDNAVQVVPEEGCSAAVGAVFAFPAIRSALLDFLHRFPMAELRGQVLNIPHRATETAGALDDASRLLAGLRAALE